MDAYSVRRFEAPVRTGRSVSHDVYERGDGRPIVLIQELPGIGQETLRLADRLIGAGFRVVLPHLFGPLGRISMAGNLARVMCMRREFDLLAANRSSPVVDWLRALCGDVRDRSGAKGVGVIGMCLTGNFAITLVADAAVLAAVASQPSMPVVPQAALHMDAEEISAARRALDTVGPMMALRFEGDVLCSAAKFRALDQAFNDDRRRIDLRVMPGRGHSVLTLDFVDEVGHPTHEALDRVIEYFSERLA